MIELTYVLNQVITITIRLVRGDALKMPESIVIVFFGVYLLSYINALAGEKL